jgi:hypothetical protein
MPIASALERPRRDQLKRTRNKAQLLFQYTDCLHGSRLAQDIVPDYQIVRAGFNANNGHLRLFTKDGTLIHFNAALICEKSSFEAIAANILVAAGFYRVSGAAITAIRPYESLHIKKRTRGVAISGKLKAQNTP